MSCFHLSDGFHRAPNVETLSMAARGLFATIASWVGGELYETPGFDGVFDKRRCRMLGGTPRMIAELVSAGLFEEVEDGYRIVESRRIGGFDGSVFKNPDKVRAGRKGGLARSRRSNGEAWPEAETKQTMPDASSKNPSFLEAKPKQNNASASLLLQADGKQNSGNAQAAASSRREAKSKPQVAVTIPTPTPSTDGSEAESQAVAVADMIADTEHAIDRDPFGLCWGTYRPMAGTRTGAEAAFSAVIEAGVTPRRLYAAILSHNRSVEQGDEPARSQPSFQHWLERGAYKPLLPPDATPKPRAHTHSWSCRHVQQIMQPHESEYDHQRQGYEPSEWMLACQQKADQLNNQQETSKEKQ